MIKNPMLDYDFLKRLDEFQHKTVYAKIILLSFDEKPVQEISGRISAGSINVDGASVVRRTCSLTMLTNQEKIDNIYWGIRNKFKLEIGIENHIDTNYPDIIWFKQGLFIITSLSESLNSTNHTINISGKDKGCLINGEIGGTIPSTTNFSKTNLDEKTSDGSIITTVVDIPIKEIIKNAIITYGGESLHNIVINDIDNYGMELLSYKGEDTLYLLYDEIAGIVTNMTFNKKQQYKEIKYNEEKEEWEDVKTIQLSEAIPNNYVNQAPANDRTIFRGLNENTNKRYSVIHINKDESVGYRKTELTYPGDLIANAGEALSSVLDKIKQMFSTFEYFYDIDGKFVFQKKKTYVNHTWNNEVITEDQIYVNPSTLTSQTIYSFEDNRMLTALSKQPSITNLRNDFAIQGVRKGVTGADIPIHMRYAISDKPVYYHPIIFTYSKDTSVKANTYIANYYYIRNNNGNYVLSTEPFNKKLTYYKPTQVININNAYVSEEYKDSSWEGKRYDWRELIYQMALDYLNYNQRDDFLSLVGRANPDYFPSGKTGYEMFYTDLQGYWRTLYNSNGKWEDIVSNPATLDFWFDFMDTTGAMGQYSIQTIGHRPKAVNDSKSVAIYYKQVPQVLFITEDSLEQLQKSDLQSYYSLSGYNFIQIPNSYEKYFSISSRGKSAQDALDDLLYQHLYCSENITLTSIPIYYLQPNNRIYVRDNKTNTNGEYLVNKITIPLTFSGTSSIGAQLAPNRLY